MKSPLNRRAALTAIIGGAAACAAAGLAGVLLKGESKTEEQPVSSPVDPAKIPKIDPAKCKACGKCAKVCKAHSAVKCENDFSICGYCVYCYGYCGEDPAVNADSKICPTGALVRRKLMEFRYEYSINLTKCIGCGACVRSCVAHGNKSLHIAVKPGTCLGCDECTVMKVCPYSAVKRG